MYNIWEAEANSQVVHVNCVNGQFPGGVCSFEVIRALADTNCFPWPGGKTNKDTTSGRRHYERPTTFILHWDGSSHRSRSNGASIQKELSPNGSSPEHCRWHIRVVGKDAQETCSQESFSRTNSFWISATRTSTQQPNVPNQRETRQWWSWHLCLPWTQEGCVEIIASVIQITLGRKPGIVRNHALGMKRLLVSSTVDLNSYSFDMCILIYSCSRLLMNRVIQSTARWDTKYVIGLAALSCSVLSYWMFALIDGIEWW